MPSASMGKPALGGAMQPDSTPILCPVATLQARLTQPGWHIVDATVVLETAAHDGDYRVASGVATWARGHIPGAVHVDQWQGLVNPDAAYSFAYPSADQVALWLASLGVQADDTLVLYDTSDGFWAARLWWVLRSHGYHALVLDGGWQAWLQAGGAVVTETTDRDHAVRRVVNQASSGQAPVLASDPAYWVDREAVRALSQQEATGQLVCALSAPVFAGTTPTRYHRRGHIPNSLNLPARAVLNDAGGYRSASEIRALALAAGLAVDQPLRLYCGGGIAASALALGLTLAGFTDIAIYDGSLQEWSADPTLPLVVLEP